MGELKITRSSLEELSNYNQSASSANPDLEACISAYQERSALICCMEADAELFVPESAPYCRVSVAEALKGMKAEKRTRRLIAARAEIAARERARKQRHVEEMYQGYIQFIKPVLARATSAPQQNILDALKAWKNTQDENVRTGNPLFPPIPLTPAKSLFDLAVNTSFFPFATAKPPPPVVEESGHVSQPTQVITPPSQAFFGSLDSDRFDGLTVWSMKAGFKGKDWNDLHLRGTRGFQDTNSYAKIITADTFSMVKNSGTNVTGEMEPVIVDELESSVIVGYNCEAYAHDELVPLPTKLNGQGLPVVAYIPIDPPNAQIVWDKKAGQFFAMLPGYPEGGRKIKVRMEPMTNVTLLKPLTPLAFDVRNDEPPLAVDELPDFTRRVFERARLYGDKRFGEYALTELEQLVYATYELRKSWKDYERQPKNLEALVKGGKKALNLIHKKGGIETADCELSSADEYSGARAFGYNVRRVVGFLNSHQSNRRSEHVAFKTPYHAWLEYYDVETGEYRILEATPPEKGKLTALVAYKVQAIEELSDKQGHSRSYASLDEAYAKIAAGAPTLPLDTIQAMLNTVPKEHATPFKGKTYTSNTYVFALVHDSVTGNEGKINVYRRDSLQKDGKGEKLGSFKIKTAKPYVAKHKSASENYWFNTDKVLKNITLGEEVYIHLKDPETGAYVRLPSPLPFTQAHGENLTLLKKDLEESEFFAIEDWTLPDSVDTLPNNFQKSAAGVHFSASDEPMGAKRSQRPLLEARKVHVKRKDGYFRIKYEIDGFPGEQFTISSGFRDPILDHKNFVVTVEELASLQFHAVGVKDPKSPDLKDYGLFFNPERKVLIGSPSSFDPMKGADGKFYKFRWALNKREYLIAYRIEPDVGRGGFGRPNTIGATNQTVNEVLRFANAVYARLSGRQVSTKKEAKYFAAAYYQLMQHPPRVLKDDPGSFKSDDVDKMAVLAYFIAEGNRLGLNEPEKQNDYLLTASCIKYIDQVLPVMVGCMSVDSPTPHFAATPTEFENAFIKVIENPMFHKAYKAVTGHSKAALPNARSWLGKAIQTFKEVPVPEDGE